METRGRKTTGPVQTGSQLPKGEFILFKRILTVVVLTIFCLLAMGQATVYATEVFDLTEADKGVIGANFTPADKKVKVMIQKGNNAYYYDLNNCADTFPLQMGPGTYRLAILEHLSGSKYAVKHSKNLEVKLENDKSPYLQSANPVYWEGDSVSAQLAKVLTAGVDSDIEKAKTIHSYIINNITYDDDKADRLDAGYIPIADEILSSGQGICYDYAVLYAAMLRSIDIPAKVVKGYKDDIDKYHAWNEVYLEDTGWAVVDTTYDAVMHQAKVAYEFKKDPKSYEVDKVY